MPRNKSIKITTTNIYADGPYTAPIHVGSQGTRVNVFLDTGSSSLAVSRNHYNPAKDKNLKPTRFAQYVQYMDGSYWKGPVVSTSVSVNHIKQKINLDRVNVAVIDHQKSMFTPKMQGILGLAYQTLDMAYEYRKPTWPDFEHGTIDNQPVKPIAPYFDQLENRRVLANKFAFYTLRSQVHYHGRNVAANPMNRGYLVLGGGEEYTSLYSGDFVEAKILHDYYYNTHLSSVRVGECKPIPVKRPGKSSGLHSNSIVDSGTSTICFPTWLHKRVFQQLYSINPEFIDIILNSMLYEDFKLSPSSVRLWPNIYVTLEGMHKEIELCIKPETYWQTNCGDNGEAFFAIDSQSEDQTILGLPFMNNYFTVFDRSADHGIGSIKFAKIRKS